MNIGKLDRRVTLQSRTMTRDSMGARVESWETVAEIWAEYVQNRGSEGPAADADRWKDNQQFRIRWRSGLTATQYRITYNGKTYDITGITEEGRKTTLLLDCVALEAVA